MNSNSQSWFSTYILYPCYHYFVITNIDILYINNENKICIMYKHYLFYVYAFCNMNHQLALSSENKDAQCTQKEKIYRCVCIYTCIDVYIHYTYTQMTTIWTQAGMIEVGGRGAGRGEGITESRI